MRLLTGLVLILVCLNSCQQRYRHVKKVKADQTQTARVKEKEKLHADSSTLQSYFDSTEHTVPHHAEMPEEFRGTIPSTAPEEEGSKRQKHLVPDHKPKLKEFLKRIHPKQFPDKNSAYEPLTSREILLVMAIFLIVLVLLGFLFGLVLSLIYFWILVLLLWGSFANFFLLMMVIMVIGLIYLTIAYFIARKIIIKRLQKDISHFELLSWFLILLGAMAFLRYLARFTSDYLYLGVILMAFILAVIYVFLY